jgi:hypothetical protein
MDSEANTGSSSRVQTDADRALAKLQRKAAAFQEAFVLSMQDRDDSSVHTLQVKIKKGRVSEIRHIVERSEAGT